MKTDISVVIVTRNEASSLYRALASVKKLAKEVVVVDLESSDDSVKVAQSYGAIVFPHRFADYVEKVRNFSLTKVTGPWVLVLDPDEELPPKLAKKLRLIADSANSADYYQISRQNIIFGKWIRSSRWWPDFNIRFFKKGFVNWTERLHGVPLTHGRGADIAAEEGLAIIHHHYDSLNKYLVWANRYADIRARDAEYEGRSFSWLDLVQKPTSEFFSRYFFGHGYQDGTHGLAVCLLQSFAELLVALKIWEKEKFPQAEIKLPEVTRELSEISRQLSYWEADAELSSGPGGVKAIAARLRRKLYSRKGIS